MKHIELCGGNFVGIYINKLKKKMEQPILEGDKILSVSKNYTICGHPIQAMDSQAWGLRIKPRLGHVPNRPGASSKSYTTLQGHGSSYSRVRSLGPPEGIYLKGLTVLQLHYM